MKKTIVTIEDLKSIVSKLAKGYGIKKVYLFGSYARGEANEYSDIDFRIDKGNLKSLFELSGFHLDLEENLNKKVDVLTTDSLDDDFLRKINREEIIVYEDQ